MFDTECLLQKTKDVILSKLDAEIDLLDTEKGDYNLDKINPNAWYFQNLSDEVFSYKNFIVWGLYAPPDVVDTVNTATLKKTTMFFEVVVTDDGGPISQNVFYKLLRYTRVLETTVKKNYSRIWSGTKVKVSGLYPTSFELAGKTYRSAGISIEAVIAD